jgi:hypothetical protein
MPVEAASMPRFNDRLHMAVPAGISTLRLASLSVPAASECCTVRFEPCAVARILPRRVSRLYTAVVKWDCMGLLAWARILTSWSG